MPQPCRLVYLITDLKVGGVPLHLYRLATRLPKEHFAIDVISLADRGPVGERLEKAGIAVHACGARHAWDGTALVRLMALLRRLRPDVLHALLFHANMAARTVGVLAGVPISRILCEIQTVEIERPWHLVVDNLTCRLCRYEIGNSPSVMTHLNRVGHIPEARLICEPGGIDVDAFCSAKPLSRTELGVTADERLVVWTGRLDPVKGFEEMLAAFSDVVGQVPAKLLLAGEGAYRERVQQLIERHRLGDAVRLLGPRGDIPQILRAADAFLFGSRTEGLPNSLLEAMAAGVPVVAMDVPGCRDVVRSGGTGLLVPAGDAKALAKGLLYVLEHATEAHRWGRAAQTWVREHFGMAGWVRRWERRYQAMT